MKIEFEINKNKYKIFGLTVGDLYYIQDESFLNPQASISITSYLSGCLEEELKTLPLEDFDILWENVQQFIKESSMTNGQVTKQIKQDGIVYQLIDPDAMTIGEFADLDIIVSSPGAEKRIHEVTAILYRPLKNGEVEPYDSVSAKARAEAFKLLPLQEANKATAFFLSFGLRYLNNTADYLKSLIKEEKTQEQKETLQTTLRLLQEAGTKLLSFLQTKESLTSMPSPNLVSECPSIGLRISRTKSGNKNSNYKKLLQKINAN